MIAVIATALAKRKTLKQRLEHHSKNALNRSLEIMEQTSSKAGDQMILFKISARKKKFGKEYMDLLHKGCDESSLRECIETACLDLDLLEAELVRSRSRGKGVKADDEDNVGGRTPSVHQARDGNSRG